MIQLIATIIFLGSTLAIVFILYKKIPILVELPKNGGHGLPKARFILKIEDKVKEIYSLFSKQIILHKFLSWVKIMTLKVEARVDNLLHGIRKKAQQENGKKK